TLGSHRFLVGGVAYSPDGKWLATGDYRTLKLWNPETFEEMRTVETPALELTFTPDSRILFAAATRSDSRPVHTITRWNVVAREELPALRVSVSAEQGLASHHLSRDGK